MTDTAPKSYKNQGTYQVSIYLKTGFGFSDYRGSVSDSFHCSYIRVLVLLGSLKIEASSPVLFPSLLVS